MQIATQRKVLRGRLEHAAPLGAKADDQFREMVGSTGSSSGSSYIEMGGTRVACFIKGPEENSSNQTEGSIKVFVRGAAPTLRHTIKSTLASLVCLQRLTRSEVGVELTVLSNDGGVLAACLMAAELALASGGIECFDVLLSCQVLVDGLNGRLILDPDQKQMSVVSGSLNGNWAALTLAIMPSTGKTLCLDITGVIEGALLESTTRYAAEKCLALYPNIRSALAPTRTADSVAMQE